MHNKKKVLSLFVVFIIITSIVACGKEEDKLDSSADVKGSVRLATTTSAYDSGLLDYILPKFTAETGWEVSVISVGSGEAMAMGEAGEVDILLVHSPDEEKEFIEEGHSDANGRADIMYNDFLLIGPAADPAKVLEKAPADAMAAFDAILKTQSTFISRSDTSGTHIKELTIWDKAELIPIGDWYIEAVSGMGAVITMTDEKLGYTLTDRATWLKVKTNTDLQIVCEKDPSQIFNNQYGIIAINPEKNNEINTEGASSFRQWILSEKTQELIGSFGVEDYGVQLFTPNAKDIN